MRTKRLFYFEQSKSKCGDITLTVSILRNRLRPNRLRVHLRGKFDTLSVYRGPLCEQGCPRQDWAVKPATTQIDVKNQTIQKFKSRAIESSKTSKCDPFQRSNA